MATPSTRRDEVLDAAVRVLVEHGSRGFTHRAVDAATAVATGTTSNYFRTRKALFAGVLERITAQNAALFEQHLGDPPRNVAELVRQVGKLVRLALDPLRRNTMAITILMLEAATSAEPAPELVAAVDLWKSAFTEWCAGLGSSTPELDGNLLFTYVQGILVGEYLDPSPGFVAEEAVAPMVRGLMSADR